MESPRFLKFPAIDWDLTSRVCFRIDPDDT